MTIVKETIKQGILTMINSTKELSQEEAADQFADILATVVESAIKSGTVTIPSGAIIVVGSATTQTNPSPAIGSIS